jgi:hypothetical protein
VFLAAGVCLSLIAQIAEQIDYLRFMPPRTPKNARRWWTAVVLAGPGWVIFGAAKQVVGLFLPSTSSRTWPTAPPWPTSRCTSS